MSKMSQYEHESCRTKRFNNSSVILVRFFMSQNDLGSFYNLTMQVTILQDQDYWIVPLGHVAYNIITIIYRKDMRLGYAELM